MYCPMNTLSSNYTLERGLLPEDEGERRGLLCEEVLGIARRPRAAVEEPEDLGVPVQLQVLR